MINNLGFNKIGDEGVPFLHKFTKLNTLWLCSNSITGKGIEKLGEGKFPNLYSLILSKGVDTIGGNKFGDEIKLLHKFKTLQALFLQGVGLTEKGVEILSNSEFSNLQLLDLSTKINI